MSESLLGTYLYSAEPTHLAEALYPHARQPRAKVAVANASLPDTSRRKGGFTIEHFLRWFRPYRRLERSHARLLLELQEERERNGTNARYPVGHFYSPLPSRAEIAAAFSRPEPSAGFSALELDEARQLRLLESFVGYYGDQPFSEDRAPDRRYYFSNPSYGPFDALMLYSMMRHARPRRIIEIGSGFSSAAMLDVNDLGLSGNVAFTFIDPDMTRLRLLLREEDRSRCTLIERPVQTVPLGIFAGLEAGDILFVDSSHVAKVGSDVNRIFFRVLPVLAAGVLIHFHDITANFEYPRDWLEEGRAWNEQYLLRAFLMYNPAFRVELFPTWLRENHRAWFRTHLPLCDRGGGGQIWLRKMLP